MFVGGGGVGGSRLYSVKVQSNLEEDAGAFRWTERIDLAA